MAAFAALHATAAAVAEQEQRDLLAAPSFDVDTATPLAPPQDDLRDGCCFALRRRSTCHPNVVGHLPDRRFASPAPTSVVDEEVDDLVSVASDDEDNDPVSDDGDGDGTAVNLGLSMDVTGVFNASGTPKLHLDPKHFPAYDGDDATPDNGDQSETEGPLPRHADDSHNAEKKKKAQPGSTGLKSIPCPIHIGDVDHVDTPRSGSSSGGVAAAQLSRSGIVIRSSSCENSMMRLFGGMSPQSAEASPLGWLSAQAAESSVATQSLGRGRFGTVASFRCRPLDRDVAVKSVDAAAQPLSAATELAFAERAIEAADRLGRSAVWAHIAELHEAAHDAVACTAHITMELLSGGPVSAHAAFRGGPADSAAAAETRERRLMRVAGDALRGLAALQEHLRVIHRDIKPDNVLLAADGTAKLADFGVAAVLSDDAQVAQDQQGSILYMSPERLRGEAHGFNSDVWSLGVTLLQLANGGLHPFMRQDASSPAGPRSTPAPRDRFWALAEVIRHTDTAEECEAATREAVDAAVATSGMSKMFGAFVQACLAANAAERPSASEMLLHPWLW